MTAVPTCPVVRILFDNLRRTVGAVCPALPDDLLAEVREAAASWRNADAVARRLDRIVHRENLPGLIIWYQHKRQDSFVPPPIAERFEPLELQEENPAIASLMESAPLDEAHQSKRRRAAIVRRYAVRLGLPLAVVLPQLINASVQTAISGNTWMGWIWGTIIVSGLLIAYLVWWLSGQWLIVPAGVVVRRTLVGKVGESLYLYTRQDSLLVIRAEPPGWRAEVWRGKKVHRRRLTELECDALLAAWQSPVPPPPLEQLSDLL